MSSSKRHFTVVMNSKEHGLYISSTPSSAAKKAVSKLCADNKKNKVEFCMRETTQGSNKKVYGPYIGYIQKLDKPVELEGRIIRYKPIAKLKKKVGKIKGGYIKGARAFIFHPAINTKNTNNSNHISKLYYFDDDSKVQKLVSIETKLNEIDPENSFHVPFISIRKIINRKEINSIEHDTIQGYYNRWSAHHNNNLNKIKELVNNNENFNNMRRNRFLFNYLITYEYGGEPVSNFRLYRAFPDYNWIIRGFINIFDGILFFYKKGIINGNIHEDNILFQEEGSSNWRMINFDVELKPEEDNLLIDINNLLEIVNDLLEFSINIPFRFDMIESVTDKIFEDIRTKMTALLKEEE
jgi:hypothetical protein